LGESNQRWYGEGDELALGKLTVRVMETPGHSSGSVCLVVEDAIFAGDTLFWGSCGRTDFPDGDYRAILLSLARLGRMEGNYRVYPGHDRATDLDSERKGNPYMRHGLTMA
jgi:glyoxylase-like metal-dependent hydrolase (beta-lactamase superfamily II)